MDNKGKDKPDKIQLTEMFMAQADNERCFYGIIKRDVDEFGNPYVFSRIVMPDGLIQAKADNQQELGKNLDQMCVMYLSGIHTDAAVYILLNNEKYFLN